MSLVIDSSILTSISDHHSSSNNINVDLSSLTTDLAESLSRISTTAFDTTLAATTTTTTTNNGVTQQQHQEELPTLHLMYGVTGDKKDLFEELEVSLKSVLINAPIDAHLHIHIVANQLAVVEVTKMLQTAGLMGGGGNATYWRNSIQITVHNVERFTQPWMDFIMAKIRNSTFDNRVQLGGYYRLLAYQILQTYDPTIASVVYMDLDIVIMANLNDLLLHATFVPPTNASAPQQLFKVSIDWINSGFMALNIAHFGDFWDRVDDLPEIKCGGDQCLVTGVARLFPHLKGHLPKQWDTHLGHGWRPNPHFLLTKQPGGVSMLHFTGRRRGSFFENDGLMHYCDRVKSCSRDPVAKEIYKKTWSLVDYYIRVPWLWVLHHGESAIDPRKMVSETNQPVGHALQVTQVTH